MEYPITANHWPDASNGGIRIAERCPDPKKVTVDWADDDCEPRTAEDITSEIVQQLGLDRSCFAHIENLVAKNMTALAVMMQAGAKAQAAGNDVTTFASAGLYDALYSDDLTNSLTFNFSAMQG